MHRKKFEWQSIENIWNLFNKDMSAIEKKLKSGADIKTVTDDLILAKNSFCTRIILYVNHAEEEAIEKILAILDEKNTDQNDKQKQIAENFRKAEIKKKITQKSIQLLPPIPR